MAVFADRWPLGEEARAGGQGAETRGPVSLLHQCSVSELDPYPKHGKGLFSDVSDLSGFSRGHSPNKPPMKFIKMFFCKKSLVNRSASPPNKTVRNTSRAYQRDRCHNSPGHTSLEARRGGLGGFFAGARRLRSAVDHISRRKT